VSKNLPVTVESLSELTGLNPDTIVDSFLNIHNIKWDVAAECFVQPIDSLGYNLILDNDSIEHIVKTIPDASFSIKVKDPVVEITNVMFNALLLFQKNNWAQKIEHEAYINHDAAIMFMQDNVSKVFVGNKNLLERLGQDFNYDYVIIDLDKATRKHDN
jgi:hypothetical protein